MGLLDRHYQEKRDFIRMKIDTPAEVTLLEDMTSCKGICHDLSGGGMLLTIDKALEPGSEIMVTVSTTHGHQPMLSAKCLVARAETGPKGSHLLGLEIVEVMEDVAEAT